MEASRLLSLRPHPRLMQTIDSHTYFMGSELAANPEIAIFEFCPVSR